MHRTLRIAPIVLLAAPFAALAQGVPDFQLPPGPTPTATPTVQGPVDPDAPVPRSPRVIPTARPTGQTPAPAPTPTPAVTPNPIPTSASTRPSVVQPVPRATTPQTPRSPEQPTAEPSAPSAPSNADAAPGFGAGLSQPPAGATATPSTIDPAQEDGGLPWTGLAGGALALLLAGGAHAWWRRRIDAAPPPTIERPVVGAGSGTSGDTLGLRIEALKLTRSMMFATLHYRATLLNRTQKALREVAIEADLTSASSNAPPEQQLVGENTVLEPRHATQRLAPGQSMRFEGEVRLPLAQAGILRQGNAALLVPLLRMRALVEGTAQVARTFVIGQSAPGNARPLPFRLDDGPRSWQPLAQRQID